MTDNNLLNLIHHAPITFMLVSERKNCGRVKKSCGKKNVSWVKKKYMYYM